jgi:hypothetical protein
MEVKQKIEKIIGSFDNRAEVVSNLDKLFKNNHLKLIEEISGSLDKRSPDYNRIVNRLLGLKMKITK